MKIGDKRVTWSNVILSFQAVGDNKLSRETSNQIAKVKKRREITVESLGLEPLCEEVRVLLVLDCDINNIISKFMFKSFRMQHSEYIFILLLFQLVAYFSERSISTETLRRNAVMQKTTGVQVHDAREKDFHFLLFISSCSRS